MEDGDQDSGAKIVFMERLLRRIVIDMCMSSSDPEATAKRLADGQLGEIEEMTDVFAKRVDLDMLAFMENVAEVARNFFEDVTDSIAETKKEPHIK